MNNYKMIIAYDGSRYKGWQAQGNTEMTIQEKLQAVLSKMAKEEVLVHGSGRTDAGVHAAGQVANFKTTGQYEPETILDYLNKYLPEDIVVQSVEEVPEQFHSRLSAKEKTYRYRLWTDKIPPLFERKYVTVIKESLNVNAMKRAAGYLIGTHDFTSFCGNKKFKKSPVRTIYDIRFLETERELVIDVSGNGFLQNMMRILVGTLIEVGRGERKPEEMPQLLEGRSRELAGAMMIPQGLCLMEVSYDDSYDWKA